VLQAFAELRVDLLEVGAPFLVFPVHFRSENHLPDTTLDLRLSAAACRIFRVGRRVKRRDIASVPGAPQPRMLAPKLRRGQGRLLWNCESPRFTGRGGGDSARSA
jgi:hypothetical protein